MNKENRITQDIYDKRPHYKWTQQKRAYDTSDCRTQSDWTRQNKTRTHKIKEHFAGGHEIIMYMTLWINKSNHNRQDNIKLGHIA